MKLQGHVGGRYGAIWLVIEVYEELLAHFEQLRQQYPIDEALQRQTARQRSSRPIARAS